MLNITLTDLQYKKFPHGEGYYYMLRCPVCGKESAEIKGTEVFVCGCRKFEMRIEPGLGHATKHTITCIAEIAEQPDQTDVIDGVI